MVNEIVAMGFTKEKAVDALKASFNNPERAVDYLINVMKFKFYY